MKKLNEIAKKYAAASAMSDDAKPKDTNAWELDDMMKSKKKRSKNMKMEDEEGLEIEIEKE